MTTEQKTITQDMTIDQVLGSYPSKAQKIAHELTSIGLHCVGCGAATYETLEMGMYGHGKSKEELETLLVRLNQLISEEDNFDRTTITITPKAAKKFLTILEEENKQGWGMRFEEKMAGCTGFEYVLDYSQASTDEDEIFVSEEIEIHVSKAQVPRLLGSVIDYIDALQGAGFKISNPNVRASCGCGNSHGY